MDLQGTISSTTILPTESCHFYVFNWCRTRDLDATRIRSEPAGFIINYRYSLFLLTIQLLFNVIEVARVFVLLDYTKRLGTCGLFVKYCLVRWILLDLLLE